MSTYTEVANLYESIFLRPPGQAIMSVLSQKPYQPLCQVISRPLLFPSKTILVRIFKVCIAQIECQTYSTINSSTNCSRHVHEKVTDATITTFIGV